MNTFHSSHYAPDHETQNRKDSGANAHPFSNSGNLKYHLYRRDASYTQTDEYPLASSMEGGLGVAGQPGRAIIQGASQADQSSK